MNNLLSQFLHWEKTSPDKIFLRQPIQGQWKTWTFRQAGEDIRKMTSGLLSLNFPARSNIAILSKNCAQWIISDLAIIMAGHVSVPLYANCAPASLRQILEHSGTKAIIVGKLDEYEVQAQGIPSSVQKICVDEYGIKDGILLSDWLTKLHPASSVAAWSQEELFTIMYTSGTTGTPKGVMFNFKAFDHTTRILVGFLKKLENLPDHPQLFSYLPLCHIAERDLTEMLACYTGANIAFVESIDTFGRDLMKVQPDVFFGVPRIWAKFQEKILEKMPQEKLDRLLSIPLIRSIVKKSIKRKLGFSRTGLKGSGAAPIPVSLLKWFDKLDICIREIYGMTENCALAYANQDDVRFGTVGKSLPTVDVKFSDEDEIFTRHIALTLGYYKEPEMTADSFTEDGYFKTGDQGKLDKEGFLTITGRVKDQFKTDKGKYVSPAPIEMKLLKNADIEQVCVVGMGIPQPIALIVLSSAGKLKSKEELSKGLVATLKEINAQIEHYEHLKRAVIMTTEWNIANGLMTPTLKVKRNEVEKIYLPNYPKWYAMDAEVVWA